MHTLLVDRSLGMDQSQPRGNCLVIVQIRLTGEALVSRTCDRQIRSLTRQSSIRTNQIPTVEPSRALEVVSRGTWLARSGWRQAGTGPVPTLTRRANGRGSGKGSVECVAEGGFCSACRWSSEGTATLGRIFVCSLRPNTATAVYTSFTDIAGGEIGARSLSTKAWERIQVSPKIGSPKYKTD